MRRWFLASSKIVFDADIVCFVPLGWETDDERWLLTSFANAAAVAAGATVFTVIMLEPLVGILEAARPQGVNRTVPPRLDGRPGVPGDGGLFQGAVE